VSDVSRRHLRAVELPADGLKPQAWGDDLPEPTPVDPPVEPITIYGTATRVRDADRRPIVPAWARNRDEARQLAAWLARYGLHVTGYHLTRTPKYAAKLAVYAPAGLLVTIAATWRWVFDDEGRPLRSNAVRSNATAEYMQLSRQRNLRVKRRGTVALVGLDVLVGLVLAATWWAPAWAFWTAVAVVVAVLGKVGTPGDRRVLDVPTVSAGAPPRLTADVVTRALQSLGIAALTPTKGREVAISYVAPITRDGPGGRADIDLPFGVTVADVMERRESLASGLRRPVSAVWPEPAAEQHAGRLVLWVGDRPWSEVKPAAWPVAKAGRVNLLAESFPFGVDQRQRQIPVSLAKTNALIGSLPGGGKTAAVRVLALAAALDPHAELRVHEHKGSGDLRALERVAHRYVSGVADEDIEQTIESMREVVAELERRAKVLGKLPRHLCPDFKVSHPRAGRAAIPRPGPARPGRRRGAGSVRAPGLPVDVGEGRDRRGTRRENHQARPSAWRDRGVRHPAARCRVATDRGLGERRPAVLPPSDGSDR
jgi:S-DNA-T family DNA segregation ATPase FtsK/SpoIIIE